MKINKMGNPFYTLIISRNNSTCLQQENDSREKVKDQKYAKQIKDQKYVKLKKYVNKLKKTFKRWGNE